MGAQDSSTDGNKSPANSASSKPTEPAVKEPTPSQQRSDSQSKPSATAESSSAPSSSAKPASSIAGKMGAAEESFIIDSISTIDSSLQSLEGTNDWVTECEEDNLN